MDFVRQSIHHVDCLVVEESSTLPALFAQLQQQEIIFPTVIIQTHPLQPESPYDSTPSDLSAPLEVEPAHANRISSEDVLDSPTASFGMAAASSDDFYHTAVLKLPIQQLSQIGFTIDQAISKFIQIPPDHSSHEALTTSTVELLSTQQPLSLRTQQLRLAEKLKERLGYLGVYYKRNPQNFLRYMTQPQREDLLRQLQEEYREIILVYFSDETNLNQKIDSFVNIAFFADVPVSQIVEIHMNLMDEFSKQLKLEGRSDEILQDYRLTLIDTIAHLCEMYRRSIPRES